MGPDAEANLVMTCYAMVQHAITYKYRPANCRGQDGNNKIRGVGIVVLICTSLLRGSGISGREEWQILAWKRRCNTNYGAALRGSMPSR
jgi:hypothetical protein